MAWTTPFTAVDTEAMTAAQFNASVRDNLLETAPAKATAAGRLFVSDGTNSIVAREPKRASLSHGSGQTRSSSSFGDLSTPGPSVTVTTGSAAWVIWSITARNDTGGQQAMVSYAVSGATTVNPSTEYAWVWEDSGGDGASFSQSHFATLNPGSNTFTLKFAAPSGTIRVYDRELIVVPF